MEGSFKNRLRDILKPYSRLIQQLRLREPCFRSVNSLRHAGGLGWGWGTQPPLMPGWPLSGSSKHRASAVAEGSTRVALDARQSGFQDPEECRCGEVPSGQGAGALGLKRGDARMRSSHLLICSRCPAGLLHRECTLPILPKLVHSARSRYRAGGREGKRKGRAHH